MQGVGGPRIQLHTPVSPSSFSGVPTRQQTHSSWDLVLFPVGTHTEAQLTWFLAWGPAVARLALGVPGQPLLPSAAQGQLGTAAPAGVPAQPQLPPSAHLHNG